VVKRWAAAWTERKAISNGFAEGFLSNKTLVHNWRAGAKILRKFVVLKKKPRASDAYVAKKQPSSR